MREINKWHSPIQATRATIKVVVLADLRPRTRMLAVAQLHPLAARLKAAAPSLLRSPTGSAARRCQHPALATNQTRCK